MVERGTQFSPFAALTGYEEAVEEVRLNIEYEILAQQYPKIRLDEVVSLLAEALCSKRPSFVLAGAEHPSAFVKERLSQLDASHIKYVFECMDKNTTQIRNIKKYLLTALFNAPATMDSYYAAQVNRDLNV